MLATPWPAPFDDEDWWFELKWDGYRCVARAERSGLRMWSRRGLDLGDRFHEVAALRLPEGWVFDGEVIAFDEAGRPDFHWHIEILPRLTNQAGFDWGTGFFVNPTLPEDAARFLREAVALQEVMR